MSPSSTMTISFPGGVAVDASFRGHTIRTDQPASAGGADAASAPFDLFLASLGTCMGFYAVRFCQQRGIPTGGLGLTLAFERDPESHRVTRVKAELALPEAFPEKYRPALVRAVDQCAVKKALADPPAFDVTLLEAGALAARA